MLQPWVPERLTGTQPPGDPRWTGGMKRHIVLSQGTLGVIFIATKPSLAWLLQGLSPACAPVNSLEL